MIELIDLGEIAKPITRPDCIGMRGAKISHTENHLAGVLYFSAYASSDEHAVPFEQWLVVARGGGWVSVGQEQIAVRAGHAVQLPQNTFHRFWTDAEEMDALVVAFQIVRGVELVRLPDRAVLAHNAASRFVALARESIRARGQFTVALSGGSTPRELYALLATPEFAPQVDWARVHFFWGDERAVPPANVDSNFKMANDVLLARVPVPPQNVHRIRAELEPGQAAGEYEIELREFFKLEADERGKARIPKENPRSAASISVPNFDLILLGLGANGHTASLFPHTRVLRETQHWVASEYIAEVKMWRITLTAPVINAAKNILWLVAGVDKTETVHEVLHGAYRPDDLPAQLIQPTNGHVVWLLDEGASEKLEA